MIIDITNEILTGLKSELTDVNVVTSFQDDGGGYPRVVFTESTNIADRASKDSAGEHYNDQSFDVNIFTVGTSRMSDAKTIRNTVDALLSETYGMDRIFSDAIPNYLDGNIYRYTLKYDCLVDSTLTIYRR